MKNFYGVNLRLFMVKVQLEKKGDKCNLVSRSQIKKRPCKKSRFIVRFNLSGLLLAIFGAVISYHDVSPNDDTLVISQNSRGISGIENRGKTI